jgi:hypothetical protein
LTTAKHMISTNTVPVKTNPGSRYYDTRINRLNCAQTSQ